MKVKVDISLTEEQFRDKSLDIVLANIKEFRHRSMMAYRNKRLFPPSMNIIPEHQLIFGRLFKSINPNRKLVAKYSDFTDNYISEIRRLWGEYYSCLYHKEVPFNFSTEKYSERRLEYVVEETLMNMAALISTTTEATKLYLSMSGNKYLRKSISKQIQPLIDTVEQNDLNRFVSEYQRQVLHYGYYSPNRKCQLEDRIKKLIINN